MIIVDTLLKQRAADNRPIRVGMFGAGFMARGIANQIIKSVPGMRLVAIANRTLARAAEVYNYAGVSGARLVRTSRELEDCLRQDRAIITDEPKLLCQAEGIECLVDVTGALEYGAMITMDAIANGKPVVSMNAELDGTVGCILKQYADKRGVILTGSDGDQPGVQMNLYRFVRSIGLTPLLCGNIKGLQDPHRNPTTQATFAKTWGQNPYMVTSFADGTKISFEQATVANATGMTIAKRGMLGFNHTGHVDELVAKYDLAMLQENGGIVDYVVGAKPSPGVFLLAMHGDPKQRHYLNLYKLGEGPLYSFYTPYHLCHFEVPLSVARVVLLGDAILQPVSGPQVDVVTTAKIDLKPGDVIDALGGYMAYGQCERYDIARAEGLLPIGLSEGCRMMRSVAQDTVITYADVHLPSGRLIDQLRGEQDAMFPGGVRDRRIAHA